MADIRALVLGAVDKTCAETGWLFVPEIREHLADAVTGAIAPALADAEREAAELERRIGDLRAFEREYRSRLIAYLEGQARELREGAS